MRFTIKYKLFLTLLLATVVVVAGMVFLVKWSFERGFLEYVNKVEQEMHYNLVNNLADAYKENGSWDFLREDPRQWRKIHRLSLPNPDTDTDTDTDTDDDQVDSYPLSMTHRRTARSARDSEFGNSHRPPPFGRHRKARVCVLDENRNAVTFCRSHNGEMQYRQITVDGKIVGYLGTFPRRKLSAKHDLRFSQQQTQFLLLLGFSMALISVLVALPVSRQLVSPVKKLAAATRKLASGDYRIRIISESSDELGDLSRDFNSLAMTLEKNEQARQQWIADISHELRTPLSVLQGEVEALQDGVREVSTDRLASLHNEVMKLNRLVNDLYELSMSDIGALDYQKQSVDVAVVLQATLENYRDEFDNKKITVKLDQDKNIRQISADPNRLQQLFSNLLTNALRYTDADGELRLKLEDTKNRVVITMEDSAPGVSDSDIPRLFERLYRVDSSRNRETGGTGLGLAICKNIVDAHGGTISAAPSLLGGLKIIIELPSV